MLPVGLNSLNRWIALKRFKSRALAAQNLRFGGHVAGAIDEIENGRIRGWVYDAHRSNDVIRLEVCVDGKPVAEIDADKYRDDLAQLLEDTGIHGFDATIAALRPPTELPSVTIRLADNPKYALRAADVSEQVVRAMSFDPSTTTLAPLSDAQQRPLSVEESGLSRLDRIEADLKRIKDALALQRRHDEMSLLVYGAPRSSFCGIGSYETTPVPDRIEAAIMRARIEQALLKARLGPRQLDRSSVAASNFREMP